MFRRRPGVDAQETPDAADPGVLAIAACAGCCGRLRPSGDRVMIQRSHRNDSTPTSPLGAVASSGTWLAMTTRGIRGVRWGNCSFTRAIPLLTKLWAWHFGCLVRARVLPTTTSDRWSVCVPTRKDDCYERDRDVGPGRRANRGRRGRALARLGDLGAPARCRRRASSPGRLAAQGSPQVGERHDARAGSPGRLRRGRRHGPPSCWRGCCSRRPCACAERWEA